MACPSGLRVSHEAIYAAIYALPRGELRRELVGCLRHAKPARGRKPKGSELRGKLCGMTNIKDRPEEVEGRLVPGHWEGDLILGAKGASAIATLVERTTRFVVLVRRYHRVVRVLLFMVLLYVIRVAWRGFVDPHLLDLATFGEFCMTCILIGVAVMVTHLLARRVAAGQEDEDSGAEVTVQDMTQD
jgi:uncharacterized membrane protein (DUF485 family)